MFSIKPKNALDYVYALFFLSQYHVKINVYSDGDLPGSTYMVITEDDQYAQDESHEGAVSEYGLAEMAFAANFTQIRHNMCDECKEEVEKTGEGPATCGHYTFESFIVGGLD